MSVDFDVRGQQEMDFDTRESVLWFYGLVSYKHAYFCFTRL